jgi:hypothetical protein
MTVRRSTVSLTAAEIIIQEWDKDASLRIERVKNAYNALLELSYLSKNERVALSVSTRKEVNIAKAKPTTAFIQVKNIGPQYLLAKYSRPKQIKEIGKHCFMLMLNVSLRTQDWIWMLRDSGEWKRNGQIFKE